ncbi:MAG: hypothetical protein ACLGXA_20510 [Acidobacteriota bacterium]
MGTNLNPLPIGPAWIDLKTGAPTLEFFWFVNQLLQQALNSTNTQGALAFVSPAISAASDPAVQAIERAASFQPAPADQSAIQALQRAASFASDTGAQVSSALQRISDLERMLAFRSQQTQTAPQIIVCTQATFPLLNAANKDSFIFVSDYAHLIYWDGTTPVFADEGSDYYALGQRATASPGWHLVDGTANVPYLKADGTLGTRNMLSVSAQKAYLAALDGADSLNPPVAPTISGNTELASTGISVSAAAAATAGTGSVDAGTGAPVSVLIPPFTGGGGGGVVTDPQHKHALTPADAPISTTGEPESFTSKLWYRQ